MIDSNPTGPFVSRERFDALQKTITRFSAVEQELIVTHDRLDEELARQKSIHRFSASAILATDPQEFCGKAAESIVGIFEVAVGGVCVLDPANGEIQFLCAVGLPKNCEFRDLISLIRKRVPFGKGERKSFIERAEDFPQLKEFGLQQVLVSPVFGSESQLIGLSLGGRSIENYPVYSEIEPSLIPSFTVFSEQAHSIFGLLRQQGIIRRQFDELAVSKEQIDLALAAADLGTWDYEPAKEVIEINSRWGEMLGMDPLPTQLGSGEWIKRIHPDDRVSFQALWAAHKNQKTPGFEARYRMRHADGSWVHIYCRGKVVQLGSSGLPIRACGTHLDITGQVAAEEQRHSLERQMLQAQKLESLGLLAGGLAHDFNNLLGVVLANVDLCRVKDCPPYTIQKRIEAIELASRRASDLVKQMLAFSGKGRFEVGLVALNPLVFEMSKLLKPTFFKGMEVEFSLEDDLPPFEGDASQIQQVVMNLITNATEAFDDGGGRIEISTGQIPFEKICFDSTGNGAQFHKSTQMKSGNYLFFQVQDHACGMDTETIQRIFDPFFSTKFTGRGLGLAAVIGIMKGHGGAIDVRSHLGAGTTATVYLPAKAGEAKLPEAPADSLAKASGEPSGLIIHADDEEGIRTVTKLMLNNLGYQVISVESGAKALQAFQENQANVTCVLLDLTMPCMDGVETARGIRKCDPAAKIILCSGFLKTEATEDLDSNEINGFLQKPFRSADLKRELNTLLPKSLE